MEARRVRPVVLQVKRRTENLHGSVTLLQCFETVERAPIVVGFEILAGPARGNADVLMATFASLKRRSCKAHIPAILAWISGGSEASVAGMAGCRSFEGGICARSENLTGRTRSAQDEGWLPVISGVLLTVPICTTRATHRRCVVSFERRVFSTGDRVGDERQGRSRLRES